MKTNLFDDAFPFTGLFRRQAGTLHEAVKQLESIPWEGSVVSAKDGKIIINRGSREGVTDGQTFVVGKIEETTDPDTGEVLDRSVEKAGVITAKTVKEKITICEATEGGKSIEKGMSVQPQ